MTLVIDASAMAELLLRSESASQLVEVIQGHDLVAPELLVAETLSVVRGWTLSGKLSAERGRTALEDFADFGVELFGLSPLVARAWELRSAVSAYDAMYVALAERLDCPLLTCDQRLARAVPASALNQWPQRGAE